MNLEELKTFVSNNDRFAKNNDIELLEVKNGYAKTSMRIKEKHLNAANVVHGGAIFTLADFAFGVASNTDGYLALAVNVSISFINSVSSGTLFAVAEKVESSKHLASYRVDISDDKGNIVAIFQGMAYINTKKPLL